MRVSILSLLPFALALASFANARVDYDHSLSARDYLDELSVTSLERRELLEGLTTREIIEELSERLDRRQKFKCLYSNHCSKEFDTAKAMVDHFPYHFDAGHKLPAGWHV
ncbi:ectomycorrhizas-regulated small secreted protein [Ephemerocybe angulata]|uniref:Ectomycorrhizas-regulated small secreted protein n=1 Tax=Ephemerocybe angulata TaxID=980116 RepID=A0A8H6LZ24_9AGAR|nr:ectomycorrhizas-regulated small secreted protein [Tulosesus angulatus]